MQLQQVVYNVIKSQIQFGSYQYGERLPTIREAAELFLVSVRTIRRAYQRLEDAGYITISRSVGVKVIARYSPHDSEEHIQSFFAKRISALPDLSRSMQLLFSKAQWLGFKNASPDLLDKIEACSDKKENLSPYFMMQQLHLVYGALGNDLLMRLIWQTFMFFQAPFLSVPGNLNVLSKGQDPLLEMIRLCRAQDWSSLWSSIEAFQEQRNLALSQFYSERISILPSQQQISFVWSSYKKATQICYTLGMKILVEISRGVYPSGGFLPSLFELSRQKKVSVNTVRRTLDLLNSIGATKTINGVGTQVLPPEQIAENCDFTRTAVQERLLDYIRSLHILALSCKQVAAATIASLSKSDIFRWQKRLNSYLCTQRYELIPYAVLDLLSQDAPYRAIRVVYKELFQQLFWGYPLRGLLTDLPAQKDLYLAYLSSFINCLERADTAEFSSELEKLMEHEIRSGVSLLLELNIEGASALILGQ